jgi:hypothetical protein
MITQFFLFFLLFHGLGVHLTMLLLDQVLYCRVIDGKWVGKFVRGGVCGLYGHTVCGLYELTVCGLYGHTVSAYALRARKVCHIATVHRV